MQQQHRFAFESSLVLDHKSPGSSITAIAVEGQHLYLGLEDGVLEVYNLQQTPAGATASLSIRKPIVKKVPIMSVHPIPYSSTILVLSADGILHTCNTENLSTHQLPFRHVVSVTIDTTTTPPNNSPIRLALAIRVNKRTAKIVACEITSISGVKLATNLLWEASLPDAPEIWGLAWVGGSSIVIASSNKYLLAGPSPTGSPYKPSTNTTTSTSSGQGVWRELLELPVLLPAEQQEEEGRPVPQRPFVAAQTLPWLSHNALLAVGEAGLVVGPNGDPVGDTYRFDGIPPVRALAAGGGCVLAICEDGAHAFDHRDGVEVQFLGFGVGVRPVPGQRIHAASSLTPAIQTNPPLQPPFLSSLSSLHTQQQEPRATSSREGVFNGGAIAVAGRHMVWIFTPIPIVQQVRELLARQQYTSALDLATTSSTITTRTTTTATATSTSSPTSGSSSSSTSYLNMNSGWIEEAYAQAALLMLEDCQFEQAMAALDKCSPLAFQPVELLPLFPSVMKEEEGEGVVVVPEAVVYREHWGLHPKLESVETLIQRHIQRKQQQQHRDTTSTINNNSEYINGEISSSSMSSNGNGIHSGGHGTTGDGSKELQRQAASAIVQYLFRARELQGVAFLPAVDTLIFNLLLDLDAAEQGTAFAAIPNKATGTQLTRRLQQVGWNAALATLLTSQGQYKEALQLYKSIAQGTIPAMPPPPTTNDDEEQQQKQHRKEAAEAASLLLSNPTHCTDTDALTSLPWLLDASQTAALHLIQARSFPPSAVLPILGAGTDARWKYLEWLVGEGGCEERELHTELAVALTQAALSSTSPSSTSSASTSDRTHNTTVETGKTTTTTAAVAINEERRLRLRRHLETSTLWDPTALLPLLQNTDCMHYELVAVYKAAADHAAALRILALTLHDMPAAEKYALDHVPSSEYGVLLHIVLTPGDGSEPHWEDACHVVATLGAHLDPLELINQLPATMPLSVAERVVAPVLRDRTHRRRQASITANLNAARLTAQRASRVEAEGAARVVVDESKACPGCHLRIGGKVFVVVPVMTSTAAGSSSVGLGGSPGKIMSVQQQDKQQVETKVICFNCWKKSQAAAQ